LLEQTLRRYPGQENEAPMEQYLADFEALAAKYSLRSVAEAIANLRITPGRSFFPKPDEVAEEIGRMAEAKSWELKARETEAYLAEERRNFWLWVDERVKDTGLTEQQVLDAVKTPGYTGGKARTPANQEAGAAR
jgi:hypothetical protein